MKKYIVSTLVIVFIGFFNSSAKDNVPNPNNSNDDNFRIMAAGCLASTAQTELDFNNVRTTILSGGDMWWDLDNAKYEIPQGSGRHSMFAGALWIGGLDDQGNLKVAGMTYRQDGNDFWPGPLNADMASDEYGTIDAQTCAEYDKHYVIEQQQVVDFVAYKECEASDDCDVTQLYPDYQTPSIITDWPSDRSDVDGTFDYLAPFTDVDGDGVYNPSLGDYPGYDLEGNKDCKNEDILFGDQTLWWVFNDNGNIHTETGSESAIGLEIQAQAFAFQTNDEINNMTFYSYKIINRSTSVLNETYFGQWVDPDLGQYQDDYVGCDVNLGLGYCYNGDADDEGAAGYNYDSDDPPPAIGVDFFRGPLADSGDGIDNDRDGTIDEPGEQIIMSKFVYYNNDFSDYGNPESATHYYGYLKGIWKNGQPMTYGETGWQPSNPECNFMFPDDTDPDFPNQSWTEITAGNDPADRRFLQSAGPFTLEPGAVNYITTGVVWARASEGNNFASVELMKIADAKAQTLFDICFEVIDGPSAPDLSFVELDKEIIINLTNSESSNNYANSYLEEDPFISDILATYSLPSIYDTLFFDQVIDEITYDDTGSPDEFLEDGVTLNPDYNPDYGQPIDTTYTTIYGYTVNEDGDTIFSDDEDYILINEQQVFQDIEVDISKFYRFEGYQIFQLRDADVTQTDLYNPDKAYMVYQCDVENYRTPTGDIVSTATDETTPIANLVNYNLDESVGPNVYVPQNMTLGASNAGISNSIRITEDKFATGNTALVNNKAYYFMAIAYAYNEYIPYSPEIPFVALDPANPYQPSNVGQKKPYLAGRKNIRSYTVIPHKIESFGNIPTAVYGTIPSQKGLSGRGNGGNFVEITSDCRNEIALNYSVDTLFYRKNMSPADISVVDPLSVPDADFVFETLVNDETFSAIVDPESAILPITPTDSIVADAKWSLTKYEDGMEPETILSSGTLSAAAQQIIPDWGLGVKFKPVASLESGQLDNMGCLSCGQIIPSVSNPELDALLWDLDLSMEDMQSVTQGTQWASAIENLWLAPMPDLEFWDFVPFSRPVDWVRSGTNIYPLSNETEAPKHYYGDISVNGTPLNQAGTTEQQIPLDPSNVHENQWLVPYKLVSNDYKGRETESTTGNVVNAIDTIGGGLACKDWKAETHLDNLNNVDVVLTDNQELWTRCPVIDMSEDELTWTASGPPMDNNQVASGAWPAGTGSGSSSYPWEITSGSGENGESKWDLRLDPNVGKDGNPDGTGNGFNSSNGWGWFPGYAVDVSTGKRLNMMFSENSSLGSQNNANDMLFNPTSYIFDYGISSNGFDATTTTMNGGHAVFILNTEYKGDNAEDNPHYSAYTGSSQNNAWNSLRKKQVIPHIQWVGYWLSKENQSWLDNEIIIRARVAEGYGYREYRSDAEIASGEQMINAGYPKYEFNSSEIRTILDDTESQMIGLQEANVVPNPYYGISGYEEGQVETKIKITNLPQVCTVSIYTVNGNLVRQFKKDNDLSFLEWDLKNNYNIQIASGMYIIHIDAGEIGEKILKWFGAMRPFDLDNF